jgi:uncharacterized protein (DUF2235 family)
MTLRDPIEPLALAWTDTGRRFATGLPRAGGWWRPADRRQNLAPEAVRDRPKRIVICADGTWNAPPRRRGRDADATNVWLLYQLVPPTAHDGTPQLAYYHAGVGNGGPLDRLLGGMCGVGLSRNILDCYRFIIESYTPGDSLYLFGFSRGAYTVRSLAGLIRNCGIVDRRKYPAEEEREAVIHSAYRLYRGRGESTAPVADRAVTFRARHAHPDCRITCIGVWDTVGALGIPVGLLGRLSQHWFGFHDVTLSSWVDRAFHAVAIDERRRPFLPTLWQQQPAARAGGQQVEQVWFSGVHADVGGGYTARERELANVALRWMINRVSTWCGLEFDPSPLAAAARSAIALHDSLKWYYLLLEPPATRYLDGGLEAHGMRDPFRLTSESLHDSVDELRQEFATRPMPVVQRVYTPQNVADYERRVRAARHAPPSSGVTSSWDIRVPG